MYCETFIDLNSMFVNPNKISMCFSLKTHSYQFRITKCVFSFLLNSFRKRLTKKISKILYILWSVSFLPPKSNRNKIQVKEFSATLINKISEDVGPVLLILFYNHSCVLFSTLIPHFFSFQLRKMLFFLFQMIFWDDRN